VPQHLVEDAERVTSPPPGVRVAALLQTVKFV
jgi:hypothetical protein